MRGDFGAALRRPGRILGLALLALAAGVTLAFLFPPSPWGWLAPFPLAALFRWVARGTVRRAVQVTLLFAAGFFTVLLWWLPSSLASALGGGIVVVFPVLVALLSVMWAVTVGLTRRWFGPQVIWTLPLAWAVLDALRAWGPFGFPWGSLGYALTMTPLVQVAEWGGTALLGLLVGFGASALAGGPGRLRWAVLAAWLVALGFGWSRPPDPPATRTALLVQGNIDPRVKASGTGPPDWPHYLSLTRRGLAGRSVDLVAWPETAVSGPMRDAALGAFGPPVILGASLESDLPRNAALLSQGGVVTGQQFKVKLVPFGEFFPARQALDRLYRAVFRLLNLPSLTGRVPGQGVQPLTAGALRLGVLICYESTFPALARSLVGQGANVLVTLSNDAWFGPSGGAEQHFQMGRVRAIETRRWWVRVGNDGVSAVVGPSGAVLARFPRFQAGAFAAPFDVSNVQTLAVRWGDWVPPVSAGLLTVLGLRVTWRRSSRRRPTSR